MNLVYCAQIGGGIAELDQEESRHIVQVLRMRVGDKLMVTDGQGHGWEATIAVSGKKGVQLALGDRISDRPGWGFYLHLAIAPPKSAARLDWFLEKVTELGVNRITLLSTDRTERSKLRHDRLQRVLIAALKQSGQLALPQLDIDFLPFTDLVKRYANRNVNKIMLTCDWGNLRPLSAVYTPGPETVILIGPEGDFTPQEIVVAKDHGFEPVLIGSNRLRTETAGVAVCAQIHVLNEKG